MLFRAGRCGVHSIKNLANGTKIQLKPCMQKLHRNTTNNACRAELGQFPLLIKIQKRAIKFWEHLKQSDPHSYQYKALQHQELSKANSPLTQLALNLSSYTLTHTNTSLVQGQNKNTKLIRINQIATQLKQNYMTHWESQTKVKINVIWP